MCWTHKVHTHKRWCVPISSCDCPRLSCQVSKLHPVEALLQPLGSCLSLQRFNIKHLLKRSINRLSTDPRPVQPAQATRVQPRLPLLLQQPAVCWPPPVLPRQHLTAPGLTPLPPEPAASPEDCPAACTTPAGFGVCGWVVWCGGGGGGGAQNRAEGRSNEILRERSREGNVRPADCSAAGTTPACVAGERGQK